MEKTISSVDSRVAASIALTSLVFIYFIFFAQVRGKDNIGATMDSMDLERQRGITIQVRHCRAKVS